MLTEELLQLRITKGRLIVPPATASHSGYALAPHGGCDGMLYDYLGETFVVPYSREGKNFKYRLAETQQVLDNPTGQFKDMTLAPVSASVMDGGLEAALKAAIHIRHPKAGKEYQLAFN